VIPVSEPELNTDRHRLDMWTKEAADKYNAFAEGYSWDFNNLRKIVPEGYQAVLLDGLWLRAPYLHNGSVPTLRDLLNPPNERPQTFHRGYDVFDPVNVGFKEPPPRPVGPNGRLEQPYFLFDTREKGNGNQGHAYGTQLSGAEKESLLEYLKTL
jgi:hypothetical protein